MPKNDDSTVVVAKTPVLAVSDPETKGAVVRPLGGSLIPDDQKFTLLTSEERVVLKTILDRDRTAKLMHGGLKSLLTLTDDQATTLIRFLERI